MRTVTEQNSATASVDFAAIPSHQQDAMCRTLIGCISRWFEDPAVKADYENWKKRREGAVNHIETKK